MDYDLLKSSIFSDMRDESRKASYLMHKDIVVAQAKNNRLNDWIVLEPTLLPYGIRLLDSDEVVEALKKEHGITPQTLTEASGIEYKKWLDTCGMYVRRVQDFNESAIQDWLSNRVLPLSRENSKILYQVLGLEQKTSKQNKTEIAKRFKAVSITDNYWLKSADDKIKWSDIDVRNISLSENLALFALTGNSDFTLNSITDIQAAAEVGLVGTYPKGCIRSSDKLFIVKGGSRRDVVAEWLSSQILGCTNVYGYCKYHLDDGSGSGLIPKTGVLTTFCEVMSTQDRDLVMAVTIPNGKAIELATSKFETQFAQIAVWDYLCGNTDRHSGNWGFFRDAPSWEISQLHDIYDNNKAFGIATYKESGRNLIGSIVGRGTEYPKTLEQGAVMYRDKAGLKFTKPLNAEWFKYLGDDWEHCVAEFKDRCMKLNIDVEIF